MVQVFHPAFNAISRASIRSTGFILVGLVVGAYTFSVSDYMTQAHVIRAQPVEFSHQHHVAGLGIDCRYCHLHAETRATAGIPATEICMNCHAVIWSDSPKLEPVRESFQTGRSISWTRIADLPDFVRFDHSVHVQKGVACVICHGNMAQMPLAWREHAMTMRWCLDCHRSPEAHVGPRSAVFRSHRDLRMDATATTDHPSTDDVAPAHLIAAYQVRSTTDCSACHY